MRILLFSWLFLLPFFTILFGVDLVLVSGQCLPDQRSLLVQLKSNLKYNSSFSVKVVTWTDETDCCNWKGVGCDEVGCVTSLDLSNEFIHGGIDEKSSLFGLQFLERLNLANNSFNLTLPSALGNLTGLKYLNLSNAGFFGQVPIGLSRLTRLVTLDLSALYFFGLPSLKTEDPSLSKLIQNFTDLTELYLDGVNMSASASAWCEAISASLPHLRVLSLSNCFLSGPIYPSIQKLKFLSVINLGYNNLSSPVPEFFAKFANLDKLHLNFCNLRGEFPEAILQVPTLQILDLTNNRLLTGSLQKLPHNGLLQNLLLSGTNFSGKLPDSIGLLKNLSKINLSTCKFSGVIPESMAHLTQLVYLDFSSNNFTGPLPSFSMSKNLTYIDVSHNSLTGPVRSTYFDGLSKLLNIDLAYNSFNGSLPSSLFSLPSLKKILLSNNQFDGQILESTNRSLAPLDTLDLSSNKLGGSIPKFFFDFQNLSVLSLSFNNFTGPVQRDRIQRLAKLTKLELSYNKLSIDTSLSFPPLLSTLKLASCGLQSFPAQVNESKMLQLDLSRNQISGKIPNWISKVGNGGLLLLNLSCNHLEGLERDFVFPMDLAVLDLHSNQLRGVIPMPPSLAVYIDYSNNYFNASIPADIGGNLAYASYFSLSNNSITGTIPDSICSATHLNILDFSNNNFSGTIPSCLIESCAKTLGVLNLRNNNLSGGLSGTFPNKCALQTLDLNGNRLKGQIPRSLVNCSALEVLNLGNNLINDRFPCFLKNLSNLRVLVFRSNKFQRGIHCEPDHTSNSWAKLQIIDLSLNNFSGALPNKWFLSWKGMIIDGNNPQADSNPLRFDFLKLNHLYHQDTVTVTMKGMEMELVKILTVFTSIDFSNNKFHGEIPDTVGVLKSLYALNFSSNALTGPIPSSIGNLTQLESLDLSWNNLNGSIPQHLASLTFLSFLNLSYNQLTGMIPRSTQLQSLPETAFVGNKGLCGDPLNTICFAWSPPTKKPKDEGHANSEMENIYKSAALGFVAGLGVFIGSLAFCKKWKEWYFRHVDQALEGVFHIEERQRRRNRRRRAYRNPIKRL
ncbi:hypothetical protein NMG60_11000155 [Bertholletia excelsa]